jgi:hypothetical protein
MKASLPAMKDYSKKLSDGIIKLSHEGWFINYGMSPAQIYQALDLLSNGETNKVNIHEWNCK